LSRIRPDWTSRSSPPTGAPANWSSAISKSSPRQAVGSRITLKATEPDVPWREIAGIGNVLRHDYGVVKPDILWGGRTYRLADSKAAVERIRGRLGG
jgi:Protein of unknown function DUF86